MSIGNPTLGDVLAQHGSPHRLLAALAEWGILVAVRPDRSVVLGTTQGGERVLLGYTSPATYARHRGSHALSACDADTILDIQRVTGVREIVIDAAGPAAAAVPIDDLQRYLRANRSGPTPALTASAPNAYATGSMAVIAKPPTRTMPAAAPIPAPPSPMSPPLSSPLSSPLSPPLSSPVSSAGSSSGSSGLASGSSGWSPQQSIPQPRQHLSGAMTVVDPGYQRTNHPILPALRVCIAELLRDYMVVHHVWISEARTVSGAPGIMLHVKVHDPAAEDIVRDLHRGVRSRLPQLAASGAPVLMAKVADAHTERRMIELGAHVVCADVRE